MARYKESELESYAHDLAYELSIERFERVIREDVVYIHQLGYVELPSCKETVVEK